MSKRAAKVEKPANSGRVTLVIPCRDGAATIGPCLEALVPLLAGRHLAQILVVDDGSRDDTAEIARGFAGVEVLRGLGRGAGSARNLGWRAAQSELIWFVDADAVAAPDALDRLVAHLDAADPGPAGGDGRVAAVGGTYGNMRPDALLSRLIHEEIVARHGRMREEVEFLATFNVLYRRSALADVGGFDERFYKGQDAELAYRVRAAGWRLRFERRSVVRHFHLDALWPYLRVQRQQGYWRVWLAAAHPQRAGGDGYAGVLDFAQPVLAVVMLALLPFAGTTPGLAAELTLALALLACQAPMTLELLRRTGDAQMLMYAPMASIRAFARGVGLGHGTLALLRDRLKTAATGAA